MAYASVTLKLRGAKRPADAAADGRRKRPRAAPPVSEDLEAAKALSGLFGVAPTPTPVNPAAAEENDRVLHMAKAQPKGYKLSDRQMDGILQLAQAGSSQSLAAAAAPSAAAPSKITFEQLRTTLWDKVAKKRIPATAYQGDMAAFLARNPHLEIYNRQDKARVVGQTIMAGMRIPTFPPAAGVAGAPEDLKVVVWHTLEQRKLSREEAPSQGQLCRFLHANPHMVVYEGQVAPAPSPRAPEHVAKPAPAKPAPAKPAPAKPAPVAAAPRPVAAAPRPMAAAARPPIAPARPPIAPARPPIAPARPAAAVGPAGDLLRLAACAQAAASTPRPAAAAPAAPLPKVKAGGVRWKGSVVLQGK